MKAQPARPSPKQQRGKTGSNSVQDIEEALFNCQAVSNSTE